MSIHTHCAYLHIATEQATNNLDYYLHRIASEKSTGWHLGTIEMIHLENDALDLRAMADRIDALRLQMSAQTEAA